MCPAKRRDPWGACRGGTDTLRGVLMRVWLCRGEGHVGTVPETGPVSERGEVGRGVLQRCGAGKDNQSRKKRLLCNLSIIAGD